MKKPWIEQGISKTTYSRRRNSSACPYCHWIVAKEGHRRDCPKKERPWEKAGISEATWYRRKRQGF